MSDIERGQFGEPWQPEERYIDEKDCTGGGILALRQGVAEEPGRHAWIGDFDEHRYRDRAMACVNALDGMRPEALQEFIRQANRMRSWADEWALDSSRAHHGRPPYEYGPKAEQLEVFDAALARLIGKEESA